MSLLPQTQTFLARAARRRQWAEFGKHSYRATCGLAGLFLILLLIARLSAAFPDYCSPLTLLAVPLLGMVIAWFTHRRVRETEAAGIVDRHQSNHDLFLTTVHLHASAGAYQEQIRQRAEQVASQETSLSEMIPWVWQRLLMRLIVMGLALMAAILWVPQLDPFGKEEERQWLGKQEQRLEDLRRETEAQLLAKKPEEEAKRSEEIKQALTKLEQAFKLAKPEERQETANRLRESQKELGQFWKQLNDEKLSKALGAAKDKLQQFGQSESMSPEAKAFRDQLREMLRTGDAKELQKKLAEMLEKADALQKPGTTPEEQRQGARELKQSLQELADAVASEAPSDQLKESLQRAIEQMQMAQNQELQKQAMEGARQSMEQLQQQMEDLAQQLQQMQLVEGGLNAAQLAQQLNELGKMPGEGDGQGQREGQGGSGMESYAELYRQLLANAQGAGQGRGPGMKGGGTGEGGVAPLDENEKTDFKTEKSKSHLVAGKTLLEWQTHAVSEAGEAQKAYQESIRQLKQGLSEAIRQEKVPAGYHGQIQRYFDHLEEEPLNADDLD